MFFFFIFFFFNDTATTEIYTSLQLFPYTTLFRSPRPRPGTSGRTPGWPTGRGGRSEEHTSELQSRNDISYAVFCLKKKKKNNARPRRATASSRETRASWTASA